MACFSEQGGLFCGIDEWGRYSVQLEKKEQKEIKKRESGVVSHLFEKSATQNTQQSALSTNREIITTTRTHYTR